MVESRQGIRQNAHGPQPNVVKHREMEQLLLKCQKILKRDASSSLHIGDRFLLDLEKILKETGEVSYESQTFEVRGYKWKLSLYPNGDEERNGKGHISIYLVIAETEALPLGWEVYANFKLFIFDQIRDKFLTIQDALEKVRRFHRMKTEWGFAQLLPHSAFHEASNGYLINDKCVFGAEISVSCSSRGERLAPIKKFNSCYTWRISDFSSLNGDIHSEIFTLANLKWKLQLYPKGDSDEAGKNLSLFLYLEDSEAPASVYAEYKLIIKNQYYIKDWDSTGQQWFTPAKGEGWGWSECISLDDIRDTSKGFVVNDTLIVEIRILHLSTLQSFSEGSPT